MNRTKIEWTDYVWNPVTGCNNGCPYCYARKMANRLKGRYGYPVGNGFVPTIHEDRYLEPFGLKNVRYDQLGRPIDNKIFVCSMGDLFGNWIPDHVINNILVTVKELPSLIFIFLTKNPARYSSFDFSSNAWIGYSTTGALYHKWDERHSDNIKFVSIEPIAEPLSISLNGYAQAIDFDWLIVGAETGNRKGKYIYRTEWISDVIDFTDKTGIALFLKNNLNYSPVYQEYPKVVA